MIVGFRARLNTNIAISLKRGVLHDIPACNVSAGELTRQQHLMLAEKGSRHVRHGRLG